MAQPMDRGGHAVGCILCDTDLASSAAFQNSMFKIVDEAAKPLSLVVATPAQQVSGQAPSGDPIHMDNVLFGSSTNEGELQQHLWQSLEPTLVPSIMAGIACGVILCGPGSCKYPTMLDRNHGVLAMIKKSIVVTRKMEALGVEMSSTVSCVELHNERVLDVFAKDSKFHEAKTKAVKPYIDTAVTEVTFDDSTFETLVDRKIKDTNDSNLIITLQYKIKDCGIIKNSTVSLVVVGDTVSSRLSERTGPLSALNFHSVLDVLIENAQRKKKTFVPLKNALLTNLMTEVLGGTFKTFFVGCVSAPSSTEHEEFSSVLTDDINASLIKQISKARVLCSVLRPNETAAPLTDIKSEVALLKKKYEEAQKSGEQAAKMEEYNTVQASLAQQSQSLEEAKKAKMEEYAKLKELHEAREQELKKMQQMLADKRLAAADAFRAQEEIAALENMQEETEREMEEQQHLMWMREVELSEARELEEQVFLLQEEQKKREEEARIEQELAQARSMVHLFRAAVSLTRDRHEMAKIREQMKKEEERKEELYHEFDSLVKTIHAYAKQREGRRKLAALQVTKQLPRFETAKREALEALEAHLDVYRSGEKQFRERIEEARRAIEEVKQQTEKVKEERKEYAVEQRKAIEELQMRVEDEKERAEFLGVLTAFLEGKPAPTLLVQNDSPLKRVGSEKGSFRNRSRTSAPGSPSESISSTAVLETTARGADTPRGLDATLRSLDMTTRNLGKTYNGRHAIPAEQRAELHKAQEIVERVARLKSEVEVIAREEKQEKAKKESMESTLFHLSDKVKELEAVVEVEVKQANYYEDRRDKTNNHMEVLASERALLERNHRDLVKYINKRSGLPATSIFYLNNSCAAVGQLSAVPVPQGGVVQPPKNTNTRSNSRRSASGGSRTHSQPRTNSPFSNRSPSRKSQSQDPSVHFSTTVHSVYQDPTTDDISNINKTDNSVDASRHSPMNRGSASPNARLTRILTDSSPTATSRFSATGSSPNRNGYSRSTTGVSGEGALRATQPSGMVSGAQYRTSTVTTRRINAAIEEKYGPTPEAKRLLR